jgi:hypothetical protein
MILKGRNKAIAPYKDDRLSLQNLPKNGRSLCIAAPVARQCYRFKRNGRHNGLRFHTPIINGQSAE